MRRYRAALKNMRAKSTKFQSMFFQFLGVKFLRFANFEEALAQLDHGATMVVPAAPALANLESDVAYAESLRSAGFALPDSGLMVLYLKLFGVTVEKYSGLRFVQDFLSFADREKKILLVNPNLKEEDANYRLFKSHGWAEDKLVSYVAPMYEKNELCDPVLLGKVERVKPDYIMLNLGGGTQEILGHHLSKDSTIKAGIICTGAALSFLTGHQSRIPKIVDRLYMGWLARCCADPMSFIPRYLKALSFVSILLKSELPAQR
jgi:N-acetylglucosaminyldiphosphoundecaprenol N-acetyl-beta-D-mannosaminyltransferase